MEKLEQIKELFKQLTMSEQQKVMLGLKKIQKGYNVTLKREDMLCRSFIQEAINIAQVPVSMSGIGSIIRLHFSDKVPADYRENYFNETNQKEAIKKFIDYLYDNGIICVNSLSFFFNTTMTDKEIEILADKVLSAFREVKPYIK